MSGFLEGLQFWHWLIAAFLLGIAEVLAPGAIFIWFAASAEQARQARQHLLGLGLPRKSFTAAAYWGQAASPA